TGNALKFTPEGGVDIEVRLDGEWLVYRVSDTGIGIPADEIENIFSEFRQVDPTITREYGGTGLGLSITKRLVEMHGGRIWVETFVPADHPLRAIRPLIEDRAIRRACRDLYAPIGRPSIPPEQLFLALVGGYLLGVASDRKLVLELQCNMALRWFVGLNLDEQPWDASTFSQNRRRRFDESGILERLFDETVARAMAEGLVSRHVSADGTLVRANASYKSFLPIEVTLAPEEYKRR